MVAAFVLALVGTCKCVCPPVIVTPSLAEAQHAYADVQVTNMQVYFRPGTRVEYRLLSLSGTPTLKGSSRYRHWRRTQRITTEATFDVGQPFPFEGAVRVR